MKSMCAAEYEARKQVLKVVASVDASVTERLRALGLSTTGIAKVRALTTWRDPETTPAGLDDVSPWFRIAVERPGRWPSNGTPVGELDGWTVMAWTT